MRKGLWISLITVCLISILLIIGSYKQNLLSVWGFNLSKNNLKDIIVMTGKHSYMITDKNTILHITEICSEMEKDTKIDPNKFPPKSQPKQIKKLLIQTKDNKTYGGHLWFLGTIDVLDSNGYYWTYNSNKLSQIINPSLKKAVLLN